MLARLGLSEEPLVDAVTARDEHSEEDERTEVPPRRYFRDEAEPPALLAVSEKVLAADVSKNGRCRLCGSSKAGTSRLS